MSTMPKPAPNAPTSAALGRALLVVLASLLLAPQPVVLPLVEAIRLADAAMAREEYAVAADALAEAAARLPYAAPLVYRAGLAEISAGRYGEAIRHIQAAAELEGWTAARRIALGDAFLGLGDRDAAIGEWEAALTERPEDAALLTRLANSYEAAGRYQNAIATLSALARLPEADPAVHYRLALLTAATTPAEAVSRLLLAAELAPDLAANLQALLAAIETGLAQGDAAYTHALVGFTFVRVEEWPLAELSLTQAISLNPEYAEAHAYLGLAQDMQGKDGLAAYERAVTLRPDSPLCQYLLGLHYRRMGDSNAALPYLQAAQALDSGNPALAAELGGAYAAMGDLAAAEVWLSQAVSLDERNPQFWLLLARFHIDNEYHVVELGLPAARMAVGLDPGSALAADALGYALILTGDYVNGVKLLERALELDPQLASAYFHLGQLYAQQGRTDEAESALNHALALDPEGPYGGRALKVLAQLAP